MLTALTRRYSYESDVCGTPCIYKHWIEFFFFYWKGKAVILQECDLILDFLFMLKQALVKITLWTSWTTGKKIVVKASLWLKKLWFSSEYCTCSINYFGDWTDWKALMAEYSKLHPSRVDFRTDLAPFDFHLIVNFILTIAEYFPANISSSFRRWWLQHVLR